MPPPADPSLLNAARECLASQFALAIDAELPAVTEVLEHQLAKNTNRDKWRPIHDALEVVRALKPHLRDRLAEAVRVRIDAKLTPGADDFSKTARFSAASLTLVSEDEVQEEIAVGNTTRRLREAAGDEFYALNNRLGEVLGSGPIADDRSPAHPRLFARALLDVIASLAPDTPGKLAAFSAFDPALLQSLAIAYRDANALLAARGVLPDFRRSYGAPRQVPGVHVVSHALTEAPAATPIESIQPPPPPPPPPPPAPPKPAPGPARLTLLDRLLANATVPQALVAELVASVFARLAADPRLKPAARAQIVRLEPAVREAAMADRRIFTDAGHPVRGLIDAMAELGAEGTVHHHVEGKYPEEWLASETQALLAAGRFDANAFAASRDRMEAIARRHHDVLVEDDAVVRSVRREDELLAAVQDAALELAHRIASADVTEAAGTFAYQSWRPVLVLTHRTTGYGSPQWNADLATLDDMLWTLGPRGTAEERERLASLIPSVRDRFRDGLIRTKTPPAQIEVLLSELDRMHEALRRSPAAAANALSTTAGLGQGIADDVTATLHVSSAETTDEGLARGAWFEFTEDDGTHLRARLNWLSPVQGACVFKEPARNRSFAISLADLRAKRDAGRARPVDGPGIALDCVEAVLAEAARRAGIDPGAVNAD